MKNRINKLIEYSLYLLVFLLPWQTRWIIKAGEINNGYWEYGTISLYGTDVLLILLLIIGLILKLRVPSYELREKEFQATSYKFPVFWYLIAGLELMIFISIFLAPDKLVAAYGYVRFMMGVGLFWLIVSAGYNRVKLIYAFLAGVLLQAGLGAWQFLTQSSFANKWLGMALHDPGVLGTSVVETLSGGRWLRAYGGLDHPNVLGGLLTAGILLAVYAFIKKRSGAGNFSSSSRVLGTTEDKQFSNPSERERRVGRGNFQLINYLIFTSLPCRQAGYLLLLISLFFTFSRGAWAGLIVGALMMLGLTVFKKDLTGQKKLLEIILAGSVLIFILFNLYGDLALTRLSQDTRLEVKSSQERVESYSEAWSMIKDNWLLGVGMGNYGIKNYESCLAGRQVKIKNDRPSWYYQPVHNVFLLVWAEIGIIGLMFFISLLLIIYCYLFKKWRENSSHAYGLALLASLCVMFLVDHWWWSLHFGVLLFWLVLGLLIRGDKQENLRN